MEVEITLSKKSGTIEYYNIIVVINGKDLKMRVTIEDGIVQEFCSQYDEGDKWNQLSNDEKEAIGKEIRNYFN